MRGHTGKRTSKAGKARYYPIIEQGRFAVLHCESCGQRIGWASETKVETCPTCGSHELVERSERRQKWLQGYDRKRDAQAALSAVIAEADRTGSFLSPSKQRLGDYLTSTWLPAIRSTVRLNTYVAYEQAVRVHVVPVLGHVEIRELRPSDLNRMYSELLQRPLSPSTVRHTHVILHRALGDGVRWQLLSRNIAALSDPPKPGKADEMKTWSTSEMGRFLAATEGSRLHPAYHVACLTGLRRGELCGLRWSDVDLDAARLQIRQTLVNVNYKLVFGTPKTASSVRNVALDPQTISVLRGWRKRQLEERIAWPGYQDLDLVFANEDGSPIHPQLLTKRFQVDARQVGLRVLRFHDLRHSHASHLLQAGVHVKIVSERLGHSNVAITLNTYSHTIPAMEEQAASKAAELIFGA